MWMYVDLQTPHFLQIEEVIVYFIGCIVRKHDKAGKILQGLNTFACFEKLNKEQNACFLHSQPFPLSCSLFFSF